MLRGENVLLRVAQESDLAVIAEWHCDPEFRGRWYNQWRSGVHTTAEDFRSFLDTPLDDNEGQLVTVDVATGEPVGLIGYLVPFASAYREFYTAVEIAYQVHPRHRGRGVATQAARLLVNHLFDATPVNRNQACIMVGNEASGRVLEGCGMRAEGELRGITFLHGRWHDLRLYSIVRPDWIDEDDYKSRYPF